MNKGWIDYFSPQLYWPVNRYAQSYPVLLGWWGKENTKQRHLWPGISIGRDTTDKNVDETLNQIMIDRGMEPDSRGVIHWNISSLIKNTRLADSLTKSVYRTKALIPASSWLSDRIPKSPEVNVSKSERGGEISWTTKDDKDIFNWVVYTKYGRVWENRIFPASARSVTVNLGLYTGQYANSVLESVIVTAVDRFGNESDKKVIAVK